MASMSKDTGDWSKSIQEMNRRASEGMEDGAVNAAYKADREQVIQLLNRALDSEWKAFLQYYHHYFMDQTAKGSGDQEVSAGHPTQERRKARAA